MDPGSSSSDLAEIPGMDPGSSSDAALIPGTSFLSFPQWQQASSGICLSVSFHYLLFIIQQQRPSSRTCLSVSLHSLLSSHDGNNPSWNFSVRFFAFFTFLTQGQKQHLLPSFKNIKITIMVIEHTY
jgi:hypothetical protein